MLQPIWHCHTDSAALLTMRVTQRNQGMHHRMAEPTDQTPLQIVSGLTTTDVDAFLVALPAQGRLIGIDGGTTTLGLALSDGQRTIASPLETINRTKFKADAARLLSLIGEHQVCGLVLGLPTNMDGSYGPRVQATRALARNLNLLTVIPVLLWDERLTTAAAERMLIEADTSRKRRLEVIDKLAATLILQGALDRMRNARF